jgi:CheY-like chemotaxis protein
LPKNALPTIQHTPPDIIILNIGSGSKTAGIEAARTIVETYQVPIIYLSANTGKEMLEAMHATKPYAFISKPFEQKDLKRGIATALQRMAAEGTAY